MRSAHHWCYIDYRIFHMGLPTKIGLRSNEPSRDLRNSQDGASSGLHQL